MPTANNRFTSLDASIGTITANKATASEDRTAAIRAAHEQARRDELAWPGSKAKVPPPNGNQNLTLQQLNALAIGPNT